MSTTIRKTMAIGERDDEMGTPIVSPETIARERAALNHAVAVAGPSSALAASNAPSSVQAAIDRVPTNELSNVDDYSGKVILVGSGNDQNIKLYHLARGYWKEPTAVTVKSQVDFQFGVNNCFFDPTGTHQFVWARAYVRVSWGDGNARYSRDILVGEEFEVVATYVEVSAWMGYQGYAPGGSDIPTNVPIDVACPVTAQIIEHRINESRRMRQRFTYPNAFGDGQHQSIIALPGQAGPQPLLLYEVSGFQNSATDLYLMLFDTSSWAGTNWGSDQALKNGDFPLWCEKVKAGTSFSLEFVNGLPFQKQLAVVYSTTPNTLTCTGDPSLLIPDLGTDTWRLNLVVDVQCITNRVS